MSGTARSLGATQAAMPELVLGSASPRRTELLSTLGYGHRVVPADIDETPQYFEAAMPYVRRMASSKADAVVARLAEAAVASEHPSGQGSLRSGAKRAADLVVLTADTVVVADGTILGKPVDEADGLAMLSRLSGRSHVVCTALSIRRVSRDALTADSNRTGVRSLQRADVCVQTEVSFRSVSVQEARRYWSSGEPRDKAGGYGIQGAASAFVTKIDGSYTNVIGLPLVETRLLLLALGVVADPASVDELSGGLAGAMVE